MILKQVQVADLPGKAQKNLFANNCELAVYDELRFFEQGGTFYFENLVYPEKQIAAVWSGKSWDRMDWKKWRVLKPSMVISLAEQEDFLWANLDRDRPPDPLYITTHTEESILPAGSLVALPPDDPNPPLGVPIPLANFQVFQATCMVQKTRRLVVMQVWEVTLIKTSVESST